MRWIVGVVGGLFIFLCVGMITAFVFGRMFEGYEPLNTIIGLLLPVLLGLAAGAHTFYRTVRPVDKSGENNHES